MNKAILHKAVDLLSRREHSIKELKHKLALKEFPLDEIELVIVYLLKENYLSNERFAEAVIRQRVNKGYGWRFIENELKQKGVDSTTIEQAKLDSSTDWYKLAENVYCKRFTDSQIKDHKERAKRMRYLQYRGFSTDEIMHAINTELTTESD